jgi:hypothetical protein
MLVLQIRSKFEQLRVVGGSHDLVKQELINEMDYLSLSM